MENIYTMNELEKSQLAEIEARLNPPSPDISEDQHNLAQARHAFDEMYSLFFSLRNYITLLDSDADPEERKFAEKLERIKPGAVKEYAYNALRVLSEAMDSEQEEPWDYFKSDWVKEGLTEMHTGDCTAVACTCNRCYSEGLYKIPYTADWKNKSEGWALYSSFLALKEKEKS